MTQEITFHFKYDNGVKILTHITGPNGTRFALFVFKKLWPKEFEEGWKGIPVLAGNKEAEYLAYFKSSKVVSSPKDQTRRKK